MAIGKYEDQFSQPGAMRCVFNLYPSSEQDAKDNILLRET